MDRQKLIQDFEATIGLAVGVVISQNTSHLITKWITTGEITVMFAIVVITLSVYIMKFFIGSLFVQSRTLRRFLLGRQYIEGTWFDIMRKDNKVAEVGFSRISYTHKNIEFSGEDYNLEMDQCFPFRAEIVKMHWPTLHYVYTSNRSDTKEQTTKGYGEIDFQTERRGSPKKYVGKYFVLRGTEKIFFEGIKLNEKKDKTLIDLLDDPAHRKEALKQLLKKYGH
ncbi:MAG: hypothetical protein O6940_08710 [Ignavibacteria bacterium]|nr:hypothetical protein [Ignavibacteria bacterium]